MNEKKNVVLQIIIAVAVIVVIIAIAMTFMSGNKKVETPSTEQNTETNESVQNTNDIVAGVYIVFTIVPTRMNAGSSRRRRIRLSLLLLPHLRLSIIYHPHHSHALFFFFFHFHGSRILLLLQDVVVELVRRRV